MKKNILIFTPHPDDHISCAGTLFKLIAKGYSLHEVLFTNGETGGQIGKVNVDKDELKKIREGEFEVASKLLGTEESYKLNLPNDNVNYSIDIFFKLIEIIRKVRPELAIIPHSEDYHRDHKQVSQIAYDSLKAADNSFVLNLGQRYRAPVILYCRGLNPLNKVDLLVDTTDTYNLVEELVKVYSTQITPRLKQYTEGVPSLAGYYMRTTYAEEFEIPKHLPMFPNNVISDLI